MRLEGDWISKNWAFLKSRKVKVIAASEWYKIFKDPGAPSGGRFYGTEEYFNSLPEGLKSINNKGNRRFGLRPYIISAAPEEGVQAVFVDPKKYSFTGDNKVSGFQNCYEAMIYVLKTA